MDLLVDAAEKDYKRVGELVNCDGFDCLIQGELDLLDLVQGESIVFVLKFVNCNKRVIINNSQIILLHAHRENTIFLFNPLLLCPL